MQLDNNIKALTRGENILDQINRGRTNIADLKILTHYELKSNSVLFKNITPNHKDFMKNSISEFEYSIFDGLIDSDGDMSNFKFRLKDNLTRLNEVNLLKYTESSFPKELRNSYEIEDEFLYVIRFFEIEKVEVSEEDTEDIINEGGLVIMEEEKYIHLRKDYKRSVQKYWTENPFKAIFKLKKLGFYLGTNDPNKEENISILQEYAADTEIVMLSRRSISIGHLQSNMAEIERIKIPFKISENIKKVFIKKEKYLSKPPSIQKMYGIPQGEETELKADVIPKNIDNAKLPRRQPKGV